MTPAITILADANSGWLQIYLLLVIPAVLLGLWFLLWRAKHIVRKRLINRPVLAFDEWYREHFSEDGPDRKITQAFLTVLSHAYSVHPTQILPSDRFDKELCADSWWSAQGMEREIFEGWVEEATGGDDIMTDGAWTTVRELILRIDQIRRKLPVIDDDKNETFTLPESLSRSSRLRG